ncbi:hypothetical protein AAF712_006751 [Marasmius tenuissimus]|uniref:Transmembrane protein n=1 Tax=Marasmius tenuissimus TaxID=585030 RepID=A0ABR2ZYH8_9AGAR
MGGFALYDSDGNFLFHLWDQRFCRHFKDDKDWDGFSKQQRKLEELAPYGRDQSYSSLLEYCVANKWIAMTEEEIQSLRHADLLAKTIVIFQTLYFITNYIARGLNGIGATELEALTLGFAFLNLVSYSFWWHKPSGVRFPVHVLEKTGTLSSQRFSDSRDQDEEPNSRLLGTGTPAMPSEARVPGILSAFSNRIRDDYGDDKEWDTLSLRDRMLRILLLLLRACSLLGSQIAFLLLPNLIVTELLPTAVTMAVETQAFPPQPERGNMFSGTIDEHRYTCTVVTSFITGFVGGLHHGYRQFPDHGNTQDHHLWTVFALVVAVVPMGVLFWCMAILILRLFIILGPEENWVVNLIYNWIMRPVLVLAILLYPIARIAMMVLAIKQLTDLTCPALQQVEWTTILPHVGD